MTVYFPPLIKPDVRFSRIRLSEVVHRSAVEFSPCSMQRAGASDTTRSDLTEEECLVLDRAVKAKPGEDTSRNTLSSYLIKVAQVGGYLARRKDPPPGNLVMWRGMRRLADLMLGAQIGIMFMGN